MAAGSTVARGRWSTMSTRVVAIHVAAVSGAAMAGSTGIGSPSMVAPLVHASNSASASRRSQPKMSSRSWARSVSDASRVRT